ncbi:MAG: electron transfer flavoprotein subunit alpha/FixB family protein [Dehalococcoidia bacterium]
MANILVVVEHRKQILADVSLEMLSKGRHLADQMGGELLAVVIGKDVNRYGPRLAQWADKVLAVKNDELEDSQAEPYQKILTHIIKERKPKLVLIGHSSFGMDLAPALAVGVRAPLATDCTNISMENGTITVTRAIYNGKVNALYSFAPSETVIVTGRPHEFPVEEGQKGGSVEEIDYLLDEEIDYKLFEGYIEPEVSEVDITKAEVLIAVGRGIKDKGNIALAEELANALGGVLACSRPVVDYGWLPSGHQVGLSGKTVKPKLYIALGISGAFQHMVGLRGSNMIVAINRDAKAPIFADANYGIVDDVLKVVPILTQRINDLKS